MCNDCGPAKADVEHTPVLGNGPTQCICPPTSHDEMCPVCIPEPKTVCVGHGIRQCCQTCPNRNNPLPKESLCD